MNKSKTIKVTLFAGGVGGAKLAEGLDNIDNLHDALECILFN